MALPPGTRWYPPEVVTGLEIVEYIPNQSRADLDRYLVKPTCGIHHEVFSIRHRRMSERFRKGINSCKFCMPHDEQRIAKLTRGYVPPEPEVEVNGMRNTSPKLKRERYIHVKHLIEGVDYGNRKMTKPWWS